LLERRFSLVPTGIDRIDIKFAEALIDAYGDDVIFIANLRRRPMIIDSGLAVPLIRQLSGNWFRSANADMSAGLALQRKGWTNSFQSPPRQQLRPGPASTHTTYIEQSFALIRQVINKWQARDLSIELSEHSENKPLTYINCCHDGLPKDKLLSPLVSKLDIRPIAYIHDLMPLSHPEYSTAAAIERFRNFLHDLEAAGAQFITNSHSTSKELHQFAAGQGWRTRPHPAPVIYPIFDSSMHHMNDPQPPEQANVGSEPSFVVIGTIEPRKNHMMLLKLWQTLVHERHTVIPHLHIVGKRGWLVDEEVRILRTCPELQPFITEHSGLDDQSLQQLIARSTAVLFPSFVEGFGIPLVEAMQLGVPIATSDIEIFHEVGGDYPCYLDPHDMNAWKRTILEWSRTPPKHKPPTTWNDDPQESFLHALGQMRDRGRS
jgi:glycosyltransferase involved in cell wall biosynthesis